MLVDDAAVVERHGDEVDGELFAGEHAAFVRFGIHAGDDTGGGSRDKFRGRRILDAGCWMLDAGCWMLDAGCVDRIPTPIQHRDRSEPSSIEHRKRSDPSRIWHPVPASVQSPSRCPTNGPTSSACTATRPANSPPTRRWSS
ncbi:MAG: hypothetical protein GC159_23860 [Phycisphaera sp.]|nr:hypothetical protein [Phycisphaera sp.]